MTDRGVGSNWQPQGSCPHVHKLWAFSLACPCLFQGLVCSAPDTIVLSATKARMVFGARMTTKLEGCVTRWSGCGEDPPTPSSHTGLAQHALL